MCLSARALTDDPLEDEFALLEEALSADEVVSASKSRQSIFWSPSAITVFTREEIRTAGVNEIYELLRRVPGFDVYEIKPYPLVGARALTEASNNLVLVLIDGREALMEFTGMTVWDGLTIDLDEVERIEVIRGPGSALYGANAFAAVVNITTTGESDDGGDNLLLSGGQQGLFRGYGRLKDSFDLGDGRLSWSLLLGGIQRGFPSEPRGDLQSAVRSHGWVRFRSGGNLDLSLHYGVTAGGGRQYLHMGDIDSKDSSVHWVMAQNTVSLGDTLKLKNQAYYSTFLLNLDYRNDFRALGIFVAAIPQMEVNVHTVDYQVQLDWQPLEELLLISGGNLRYTYIGSNAAMVRAEPDEFRGGVFVHLRASPFEILQLTGGLRLDFNSNTEEALSPRVAAVLRPVDNHSFRLGYGLSFRKPSYVENRMHLEVSDYNSAMPEIVDLLRSQVGNEDLENEKVHSFEFGWRTHLLDGQLQASLDLFYSMYRNTILFVAETPLRLGLPDIAKAKMRYENEGTEVDALGGEAELSCTPTKTWSIWVNLGLRRVTERFSGDRVLAEPVLRANAGGRYHWQSGLFLDVSGHYVSEYRVPQIDPTNTMGRGDEVRLGNVVRIYGRLGYRLEFEDGHRLEAGLLLQTPLGANFREYPGMPVPPGLPVDYPADFGAEEARRIGCLYLRGSY